MPALTGFPTATNSTTLTTARTLATAASGAATNASSTVAKNTGLFELLSQGGTPTSLGATGTAVTTSSPAVQVHGWLLDSTLLEGTWLTAGSVQPTLSVLASASTISGRLYVRYWKRSAADVYTNVGLWAQTAGAAFSTTAASRLLPAASVTPQVFFGVGDKLYAEVLCDVTANTANSNTATVSIVELGTTTPTGFATAGYQFQPMVPVVAAQAVAVASSR